MVSVSFQTMLQASSRLLKGLRQLLTRRRVEIDDNPELPEEEREVGNLQRSRGDLEDLEKAFADIRLSLSDREGGEVLRAPPGTKLSFHALPVGKLKFQIGTHHTDALVEGEAEITLIRRDFTTITGCTVNKEVMGSIRRAGGEIMFAGYVTKCAVKTGIRKSIWSFQRMTVMEEMDHDIILGRPWCANVEMIGMHLHDDTYMVDIQDPVTGRGELLRLLGMGGDPPKGKLATWSPSFEDSARKRAFARMEGMRKRVEIMIEETFNKKEWIKMGLPQKKRRQEDEVLGVMVAENESEVELVLTCPNGKKYAWTCRKSRSRSRICYSSSRSSDTTRGDKGNPDRSLFRKKISEGSVRKYKPVGKKAKSVSILLETSKEEAMEKEEEVLLVIQERRATKGHRIPDAVADTMKIGVDGFLTEEENLLIKRTCQEFHLTFVFSDHQKGQLDAKLIPPVRIHTVEHECWNDKGPSYVFGIAGEVTDLLRAKMDSFVAEPAASPYANRWFAFRKPNKTLRWIQDLQKLNAVTIRDAGSLPQADLLAEPHAGRSIYSLIDLYSRYDQLPLDVRDRPYTAMHTPVGQLQMQVTPMGFTNAVAEAQRRMLVVAGDMFPEKCEPYIDDNPIKGAQEKDETGVQPGIRRFVWDHLQDIKDLLRRFLVYNITASGPKSILAVPEFDYKIEWIAGIRNKADGLSRVCITPEGVEEAEPIDAFLEFEGETLAVDNEMMGEECALGELLIRTSEKVASAIVAELREGPVTTRGRKEERDSWGAIVGPKEELIAMAVEGGREAVMNLVESWEKKELQWMVNQMQERKDEDHEEKEFFYAQTYEGIFREIGLLLPAGRRSRKTQEKVKMEFGNENDSGAINMPTGGEEAVSSQGRRTAKRELYIGLMSGPVVGRGGKKCVCRRPSPLRKGEGIEISYDSEGEKKRANVGEGSNADMGDKAQASGEEGANTGERRETWHGESEGGQDMHDEREDGKERRESPLEGRSGHDSSEGYETRTKTPYTYDPKNLTGRYSPIQTEDEEDEEEDVQEIIEISSGDERDEISKPREERWSPMHQPRDEDFRWEDAFGPTPSHWFQQWTNVIRHEWIIKARELAKARMEATPLDFFGEAEL
ncbi:hypothetical protein CBR_g2754 [Chara braunii]|uniref:Reverse transcriptase domain-containing protein n=1 Tax=Chara braunii TaxID=69332 RepID=A0A388KDR5_CHABU|nr:hypothetical protein CBR_g2754 [Chara braunii]|eukprot:GBG68202.1 hypothetical protein CBR_g2754 [Chara braunii]